MPTQKSRRKRIAFGGQKGGPGKTTVVACLAEWLLQHNRRFRLLDGNTGQQSLTRWTAIRDTRQIEPAIPVQAAFEVVGEPGKQWLRDRSAELLQDRFDGVTLLDLVGCIDDKIGPALLNSDVFIVPLPPQIFDYLSLTEVFPLVTAAQDLRAERGIDPLKVYLLLNRVRRSKGQDQLRPRMQTEAPGFGFEVCRVELSDANDHFTAQLVGRTVVSYAPESRAATQIHELALELGL